MQDVRFHFVELWSAKIDEWLDGYFYSKLSEKTMTMDYPMTESPETLGQCRKAQEGMAGLTGCFLAVFAENTIKEYGTHEELVEKDKGIMQRCLWRRRSITRNCENSNGVTVTGNSSSLLFRAAGVLYVL